MAAQVVPDNTVFCYYRRWCLYLCCRYVCYSQGNRGGIRERCRGLPLCLLMDALGTIVQVVIETPLEPNLHSTSNLGGHQISRLYLMITSC